VYLTLAILYDVLLYAYMYKTIDDAAQRADVLGSCSGLVTTVLMTLPAFEVVRTSLINCGCCGVLFFNSFYVQSSLTLFVAELRGEKLGAKCTIIRYFIINLLLTMSL